ncbi:unnamed protein product [Lathyrus oleraceus]
MTCLSRPGYCIGTETNGGYRYRKYKPVPEFPRRSCSYICFDIFFSYARSNVRYRQELRLNLLGNSEKWEGEKQFVFFFLVHVTGRNFGEIRWMVRSSVSRARHSVASNALPVGVAEKG